MKNLFSLFFIFAISVGQIIGFAVNDGPTAVRETPPPPVFTAVERRAELIQRRAKFAAKMADKSIAIFFSAAPKLYTNDVNYVFRQENNLYYLTGLEKAGAALVIAKDGPTLKEAVFLPKRDPRSETWSGKMYSDDEAANVSGIKTVIDATELDSLKRSLMQKVPFSSTAAKVTLNVPLTLYLLLPESAADEDGAREFAAESAFAADLAAAFKIENARPLLASLREIKSPFELAMLQHAIDITTEAQMRAMAMSGRLKTEYEAQAEIEYTFRRRNADFWGYPSIVGAGQNATTLHYEEASGPLIPGQLLLTDVGAEYEHYTADVTRTFPINGKFTTEQADIYKIVFDAQEAAARVARPGGSIKEMNDAATAVIKDGLLRLGLITDANSSQYRLFFMHGIGHPLGMNVHDVTSGGKLKTGMVLTDEPGIYIRADALDYLPDNAQNKAFLNRVRPAFEKYKNIGVRIEDDLLITDGGVEWLTKNLPRRMTEIESFMSRAAN